MKKIFNQILAGLIVLLYLAGCCVAIAIIGAIVAAVWKLFLFGFNLV